MPHLSRLRTVGPVLIILSFLLPACDCPATGTPAVQPIFPDLDIDTIHSYANLTWDLTQLREGELSEDQFRAKHQMNGDLELRSPAELEYTYALITVEGGDQLLVLPGTTSQADVERDLMLVPVMDDELGVNLHEGFQSVARAVRDDVSSRLSGSGQIGITGYSLGGAVAVILGAYLDAADLNVSPIVTFGQPRVTDEAGVGVLDRMPLRRIISGDDPICGFPAGYHQFGDALILLDGPELVLIPYGSEDYTLLDDLVIALNDTTFQDHVSYVNRVGDKLQADLTMITFSGRSCHLRGSIGGYPLP